MLKGSIFSTTSPVLQYTLLNIMIKKSHISEGKSGCLEIKWYVPKCRMFRADCPTVEIQIFPSLESLQEGAQDTVLLFCISLYKGQTVQSHPFPPLSSKQAVAVTVFGLWGSAAFCGPSWQAVL